MQVSAQAIDAALYDAFGQHQVSTMYTTLNQYHVVMEANSNFTRDPTALQYVYALSTTGTLVPLSAFAKYAPNNAPLSVAHQSQFPCVTLCQSFGLAQRAGRCRESNPRRGTGHGHSLLHSRQFPRHRRHLSGNSWPTCSIW